MRTQVWLRNPDNYVREVVEVGHHLIAFDRGYIVKKSIDTLGWADIYFPTPTPWRILHVGVQGTAEYKPGDDIEWPTAVYPTWEYGQDTLADLEELLANPVGESTEACGDERVPSSERPVLGQEHRVVIVHLPEMGSGPGRKVMREIAELQREYPDAIVHVHGLYGFRAMFSHGIGAVDVDARTTAQKGKVILPNGKEMTHEATHKYPNWVTLLGMSPVDLEVPRNRCIYIMKSALWAGEHYMENFRYRVAAGSSAGAGPDVTSPSSDYKPPTTVAVRTGSAPATVGDKMLCDTCSLQTTCKYARDGAVCSVPGSEPAPLARFFKTRDSGTIIDGLGTVLAAQTRRLERGMEDEEDSGELDPEVTKIVNSLMTHGVKLAKLVDPALAAAGAMKVGVVVQNGQGGAVAQANPKSLVAGLVAELEARGVPRNRITPEMIENMLGGGRDAIEGVVVAETA